MPLQSGVQSGKYNPDLGLYEYSGGIAYTSKAASPMPESTLADALAVSPPADDEYLYTNGQSYTSSPAGKSKERNLFEQAQDTLVENLKITYDMAGLLIFAGGALLLLKVLK